MKNPAGVYGRWVRLCLVSLLTVTFVLAGIPAGLINAAEVKLTAVDGSPGDHFGSSVALDGNTAVVGASTRDNFTGAAYIFTRTGATWGQQAKLVAPDAAPGDSYGNSVAISGDTAVVGAFNRNGNTGAAYVFVRVGSTWSLQGKLTSVDISPGDRFGSSVAISGDTIVIGAYQKDNLTGAAYVFTRAQDNWSQQAKLIASDAASGDWFGFSVSINRDTALLGALFDNSGTGAAYIFTRSGSAWNQQAKLTTQDSAAGHQTGSSVSISGDTAVLGARGVNSFTGAAYVFVRTGSSWVQQAGLTAGDKAANDRFGASVSLSANTVVIGAEGKSADAGAAYVFTRSLNTWGQQSKITASDTVKGDSFGNSVSISGDSVLVGAREKNETWGAAYAYNAVIPLSVSTFNASSVTANSATLNGALVSLGAAPAVNVYFEYGLTTMYGSATLPKLVAATGPFSAILTGLTPNTIYHFRARADVDAGPDMTFITTTQPATTTPVPTTTTVLPPATAIFTATVTTTAPAPPPSTVTLTIITIPPPATTFITPPPPLIVAPAVASSGVSSAGTTTATLNGDLTSMGTFKTVNVYFEYGTTADYGSMTAHQAKNGTGAFIAEVSGLAPGTAFHFRAVADGASGGISSGLDKTFSTKKEPSSGLLWLLSGLGVLLILGFAILIFVIFKRRPVSREQKTPAATETTEYKVEEEDVVEKLQKLGVLRQQGLITDEEYEVQKHMIIKKSLGD